MADDLQEENLLNFPERINYPKEITLYREIEIRKEKGGQLQKMSISPIASYSQGFIYGWEICSQGISDQGYKVLNEPLDEIKKKTMMIQTWDGYYTQGALRGYLDCQLRLKFLFENKVLEQFVIRHAKKNILPRN
ncbi:hypothetical protein [uncultured Rubinisphaera sp.]|uniref:hypothetical protein n=1 Tax=uncultured Rubinisphaera sp. TaxID=1678686 RepID=UPI0030D781A0|tara:strand:- start:355 stop:759 length:405 start_codon:yes stop_codon:yes gene_type:complete